MWQVSLLLPKSSEVTTAWYPVPGPGPVALYETRSFIFQTATSPNSTYKFSVRLHDVGESTLYSSPVTFTKFKIIIATTTSILTGGRTSAPAVDLSSYEAVCKYYKISE